MSTKKWPDKAITEELDYTINWAPRLLNNDVITASAWTVPSGLTKTSESFTNTTSTVWFTDGVLNSNYSIVNLVTTSGGRIMQQTVTLKIGYK
jgi:hypothetical protein